MNNVIDWIIANEATIISVIAPVIYEVIARLKPTTKDWSVISIILKVLNGIVPNKSKSGGTH